MGERKREARSPGVHQSSGLTSEGLAPPAGVADSNIQPFPPGWYQVTAHVYLPDGPGRTAGWRGLTVFAEAVRKLLGVDRMTLSHVDLTRGMEGLDLTRTQQETNEEG